MGKYDKDFHAFTRKFGRLVNVLHTSVKISEPFVPTPGLHPPQPQEFDAIWDTGASMTAITKKAAKTLKLKPTGKIDVSNTSGQDTRDTYMVNVYLPSGVVLTHVKVVECEYLSGNFELLIGMDVIAAGDFSITNVDGKTTMSYRIPSIEEIDYVKEARMVKQNRKIFGKIEQEKERRKANLSQKKLRKRRKKEKLKKKARKKRK